MHGMTQSPPQATVSKVFWSWIGAVIGIALAVSNIPKGRRYPGFRFQRGRALPHWRKRKTRHLQHENKDAAMHTKKITDGVFWMGAVDCPQYSPPPSIERDRKPCVAIIILKDSPIFTAKIESSTLAGTLKKKKPLKFLHFSGLSF
ncbi:MAG: hypothetical protein EOM03_15025 [Clostridia bacterium]|nr:hypothetical protein [Clostridia bacterium]